MRRGITVGALAAIVAFCIAGTAVAGASKVRFPPIDEGARDRNFAHFRQRLIKGFATRDLAAVKKYTHPDIIVAKVGVRSRKLFLERLQAKPDLWRALLDVLKKGGRFTSKSAFRAPYTAFVRLGRRDPASSGILTGRQVTIRVRPNAAAAAVAVRAHEIVSVPEWRPDFRGTMVRGWRYIRTIDGKTGYVQTGDVDYAVTYTLDFVRINGVWWLNRLDSTFR